MPFCRPAACLQASLHPHALPISAVLPRARSLHALPPRRRRNRASLLLWGRTLGPRVTPKSLVPIQRRLTGKGWSAFFPTRAPLPPICLPFDCHGAPHELRPKCPPTGQAVHSAQRCSIPSLHACRTRGLSLHVSRRVLQSTCTPASALQAAGDLECVCIMQRLSARAPQS